MQNALVNALVSAVTKFWPQLEPLIIAAGKKLLVQVLSQAKAGTFPDQWKWAEPVFDSLADELLKLLQS